MTLQNVSIEFKVTTSQEVKDWFDERSADLGKDEVLRRALLLYHLHEKLGEEGFRTVGLKEDGGEEEIYELPEDFFELRK